jgi:hypothetical protein
MKPLLNTKLLSRYTAEFSSKSQEEAFLSFNWYDNKSATRNTFMILVFFVITFFFRDLTETGNKESIFYLFLLRLAVFCVLFFSSIAIHRTTQYCRKYHSLVLVNQIVISVSVFVLAVIREMPIAYLGVNIILLTLVFYQFIHNRFYYTLAVCGFLGAGAIFTSVVFLDINASDLLASALILIPLNFLGVTILRSNNKSRRYEYLALTDLKKSNDEKETAIQELKSSLAEVKTLRGFLPICAKCKKIRDDEGYWNQIELYIEKHSEAQFSHGICQECAEELYGEDAWYKRKYNNQ